MKKTNSKKVYRTGIEEITHDLDEAIGNAGSFQEFKSFNDTSFKFYQQNLGLEVDEQDIPHWPASIYISDKFFFAIALHYLGVVYGWNADYLEGILMEEYEHYDKAILHKQVPSFILRFYKDKRQQVVVEPSTFIQDSNPTSSVKSAKQLLDIADVAHSSSKWDEKLKETLKHDNH